MRLNQITNPKTTVDYLIRLHTVCHHRRLRVEQIGQVFKYSIPKIVINPGKSRTLLITAGIHGDEEAGPIAISHWIERASFPFDLRLILLPLLNPTGYAKHTRYNKSRRDLNRGFNRENTPAETVFFQKAVANEKIHFLLSLHEDNGHDGLYLYHTDDTKQQSCRQLIKAASGYCPIERSAKIYGDKVDDGLICVSNTDHSPKNYNSLEYYMKGRGVPYITFETPGAASLRKRVLAQIAALEYIIRNFDDFTPELH
jgi:protein MpaA